MKKVDPSRSFNQKAEQYEEKWKDYLRHTHERFLQRIITSPGETILDVSAGTGLLAQELISSQYPFARLVLNDPSRQMLKLAGERLGDEPRISFTQFLAHELPFDPGQFDRILCLNAFHFYREQQRVMRRFCDILKPAGRLYLLDWNRSGFFRIVNCLIRRSETEHVDTRSLTEMIRMADNAGFRIDSRESWRWRYWKFLFMESTKIEHE